MDRNECGGSGLGETARRTGSCSRTFRSDSDDIRLSNSRLDATRGLLAGSMTALRGDDFAAPGRTSCVVDSS